ncbi:Serine/threonine-protein kinase plk1, partial [Mortierella sp. GBA35]
FQVVDTQGDMYALKTYCWDKATEDDIDNEINMFENPDRHDNQVRYFGVVNNPVKRCFRLEFCLDRNLNYLLKRRGKLAEEEVWYIGTGIEAGLAHLHKKALIHCDSKHKNPWTGPVDAKGFAAPEVLNGETHTFTMDAFSFGVVMFMMLEGYNPELIDREKKVYTKGLDGKMNKNGMPVTANALMHRPLDFKPSVRPQLRRMHREKSFTTGCCPSELHQSIFDEKPDFKTIKRKFRTSHARRPQGQSQTRHHLSLKNKYWGKDRHPVHIMTSDGYS